MTTGHEWNGIKELNTAVPRPVYFFLITTFLFAVVYWLLMPAWPTGGDYTKGMLGIDQREQLADSLSVAADRRADWLRRIAEAEDFEAIRGDPALMAVVRQTGPALFGDNCAVCHGTDGAGGKGYPNLRDQAWLWGGDPETVFETLRVGINSRHPESRIAQMLAFGRDQMLPRDDILTLTAYVQALSGTADAAIGAEELAAGRTLFADNCAACHGENGKGDTAMGAPDLTDGFWIYGGDRQAIFETLHGGRAGHMPSWEDRLGETDRKILTLYVLDLGQSPADAPGTEKAR
jgi:cytochrome c oxidase cbb3-type subunit 3